MAVCRQNIVIMMQRCQLNFNITINLKINLFELKDRICAMPGPKNIMIWIFVTLFDQKDLILAMSGPKNVMI
eukprot:1404193-Ditylum_brightwellii.AAC.1